jgi:hypothetical protein
VYDQTQDVGPVEASVRANGSPASDDGPKQAPRTLVIPQERAATDQH